MNLYWGEKTAFEVNEKEKRLLVSQCLDKIQNWKDYVFLTITVKS